MLFDCSHIPESEALVEALELWTGWLLLSQACQGQLVSRNNV